MYIVLLHVIVLLNLSKKILKLFCIIFKHEIKQRFKILFIMKNYLIFFYIYRYVDLNNIYKTINQYFFLL